MPKNYKKGGGRNSGRFSEGQADASGAENEPTTPLPDAETESEQKMQQVERPRSPSATPPRPTRNSREASPTHAQQLQPLSPAAPPTPPPTPAQTATAPGRADIPKDMISDGGVSEATPLAPPAPHIATALPTPDQSLDNKDGGQPSPQAEYQELHPRLAAAGDPSHSPTLPPKSPGEEPADEATPLVYPNKSGSATERHVSIVPAPVNATLASAGKPTRSPTLPPMSPSEFTTTHKDDIVHPRNITPTPDSTEKHVTIIPKPTETSETPIVPMRSPAAADVDQALPARLPVKAVPLGRNVGSWLVDAAVICGAAAFISRCF
jgi:hypothetical protein